MYEQLVNKEMRKPTLNVRVGSGLASYEQLFNKETRKQTLNVRVLIITKQNISLVYTCIYKHYLENTSIIHFDLHDLFLLHEFFQFLEGFFFCLSNVLLPIAVGFISFTYTSSAV